MIEIYKMIPWDYRFTVTNPDRAPMLRSGNLSISDGLLGEGTRPQSARSHRSGVVSLIRV
jgi:hypothetical protein